jgi:uncharacterized protein (DUF1501 family)
MTTRRFFLKSSGLALVSFGALPEALVRSLYAADGARRKKTLVVVFQRGACDGLNTVVPHGEKAYYSARPTIAIPAPRTGAKDTALDLDGFFGLHPSLLSGVRRIWPWSMRSAAPTPPARTSTPRTSWRAALRAASPRKTAG